MKPFRYSRIVPFLVASAVAGGCGAQPGTSANSAGKVGLSACRSAVLSISVTPAQAGAAAGSTYLPLNFTNTSSAACEMNGYPGVSLMTAPGGKQVGAPGTRDPSFGVNGVVLQPGHSAHAWLQLAQARNYPAHACDPVVTGWLAVSPPGQADVAYIPHKISACRSAVDAIVTVLPVRPGNAARGSVP